MTNQRTPRKIRFVPKVINFIFTAKMRLISLIGGHIVGARALIIQENRVLLIQHTYNDLGWLTVGGGVNKGETAEQAICREVEEEASLRVEGKPKLFGIYHSRYNKRDDHIIFYIIDKFSPIQAPPSPEIETKAWFDLQQLPEDVSPATKRRIDEFLGLKEISGIW
jgi:8-oxo-dGTP pyrophosphatase MutT (NUDIX family)